MNFEEKLLQIKEKYFELEKSLMGTFSDPREMAKISKEYSNLKPVVALVDDYLKSMDNMGQAGEMMKDPSMKELAEAEYYEMKERLSEIGNKIKIALLPKDEADERAAILEIRAGTGGDEAAIFAGDLFDMYKAYAERKGWKMEVIDYHENEAGGFKEIISSVAGPGAFGRLKFESGAHRVQRVPETESQGRVHTSAATVAVMPEAEDVDVEINPSDLRIDTYRASGAGGQHVNKTDSAIRITHIPTNTVVQCQDERSQLKNKDRAMKMLRARLYDAKRRKLDEERAGMRKSQVGTGDRSDKIRTYNYPQNRVTDHRVNLTLYKLDYVMLGEALDEIIDKLVTEDQLRKLSEV
ncbi:MAG: peptide chain release factor 1 [Rickettsiales bacterium]|jgi:peptide chain release factor 1|nr:peptide chain release factor 1 [Rickettsiales bacterium]